MPDVPAEKEEISERLNALIQRDLVTSDIWISDEELDNNPELIKTLSVNGSAIKVIIPSPSLFLSYMFSTSLLHLSLIFVCVCVCEDKEIIMYTQFVFKNH